MPEKPEPLEGVSTAGGKLIASYLKDVMTRGRHLHSRGKAGKQGDAAWPRFSEWFWRRETDKFVFYTFTSFNYPPTIFRYDIPTHKTTLFRAPEIPGFRSQDYETKQVFYKSKDGTRIPMFLVYKKGLNSMARTHVAVWVWRLQRHAQSRLQRAANRVAGAGRRLRAGEPARRRRIWREVARGGGCGSTSRTSSTTALRQRNG